MKNKKKSVLKGIIICLIGYAVAIIALVIMPGKIASKNLDDIFK